ncbi:MAG: HAMP domain-containing sensor histidine kinase [Chitinophagaceae bacterium]
MKIIPLLLLVIGVFIAIAAPEKFYQSLWLRAITVLLIIAGAGATSWLYLQNIYFKTKVLKVSEKENIIEVEETLVALKASEKVLRQKARLQEQLITSLTHDIKSPLKYLVITARNVYEETSSRSMPDIQSLQANVRLLYDAAYRMYYLTDNLLQYIKLHSKDEYISYGQVNIFNLVEDRLFIFRDMAYSQSIPIVNNVSPDIAARTNAHLLGIILYNLLDNAIKFTHEGEITVSCEMEQDKLYLEVRDSGIGMDEDLVAWCNTNDEELSGDAKKAEMMLSRSKGLGLVIVKELTTLINAQLRVKSDHESGTTMLIILNR